jgi:hypothetical protein
MCLCWWCCGPQADALGVPFTSQGNRVAVKMLNLEGVTPEAKAMLHQEAAIMCQLHHPSVARVFGECIWLSGFLQLPPPPSRSLHIIMCIDLR